MHAHAHTSTHTRQCVYPVSHNATQTHAHEHINAMLRQCRCLRYFLKAVKVRPGWIIPNLSRHVCVKPPESPAAAPSEHTAKNGEFFLSPPEQAQHACGGEAREDGLDCADGETPAASLRALYTTLPNSNPSRPQHNSDNLCASTLCEKDLQRWMRSLPKAKVEALVACARSGMENADSNLG